MKLSDGVEWGAHCVLLLAALPMNCRLSGRALAEFHGVPESYLMKHLKSLAQSGVLTSASGPKGGFGLAKNPSEVSLLDIVEAVEGPLPAFRCSEIRQRGPCSLDDPNAYPKPCGINRAMLRAEEEYRSALAKETIGDLLQEFSASVDPRITALGEEWVANNIRIAAE